MDEHATPTEIRAALDAGDHERIATIIESDWPHLLDTPDQNLTSLLGTIPPEQFQRHPALALILQHSTPTYPRASTLTPVEITQVEQLLESGAYQETDLRIAIEMIVLLALKDYGAYRRAIKHAVAIHAITQANVHRTDVDHRKMARACLHAAIMNLFAGDLFGCEEALCFVMGSPDAYPADRAAAAAELALLHALNGEHAATQRLIATAESLSIQQTNLPGPRSALHTARAIIATDRLDWRDYDDVLGEIQASHFILDEHFYLSLYAQARAAHIRGQQRHMLNRIQRLQDTWPNHSPGSSFPQTLLGSIETHLALSIGDYTRARAAIPDEIKDYRHTLQLARWQLATGRHTKARDLLTERIHHDGTPRRGQIDLCLTLSTAHARTGETGASTAYVRQALIRAGDPETILYSLAATDRHTLDNAARHDPRIGHILAKVTETLAIHKDPHEDTGATINVTPRERLILRHLATGSTAQEIANDIFLSVHTVRNHTRSLYRKLNATSRRHAIAIAKAKELL